MTSASDQSSEYVEALQLSSIKIQDFQSCYDNITLFNTTYETGVLEKIKDNMNLCKEEKMAVNIVFRSVMRISGFHNERTKDINEISINYLEKYQAFAHENIVAMRLTEVILYSLCSSECKSLVVANNYFLKYFDKNLSPEIQLGAVVANSFLEKEISEKSNEDIILFILDILKKRDLKDFKKVTTEYEKEALTKPTGTILGFSRKEVENCLYREVLTWTQFTKKYQGEIFSKSLYHILCQILEGINHLDSSQIFQIPFANIIVFNEKHKSTIFKKWKDNNGKLDEQDRLVLNCFYVSINILSKCCAVSENIDLDEITFLIKTFQDFSDFISSNFISQRICEALLYCICNVVDKMETPDKGFWVKKFEQSFVTRKSSNEIKLTSSYILCYLTDGEDIQWTVLDYLTDMLKMPTMNKWKRYCGFTGEEIQRCIKALILRISTRDGPQSIIEHHLRYLATNDEYDEFIKLMETKIKEPKLFANGETLVTSLLKDKNLKYCWAIINYADDRDVFNLTNALKQIPLQIAIETDLHDLISPLILVCNNLNNEDNEGNTPLQQLFQKLSISTDMSTTQKLMAAIKLIILKAGDIYKGTSKEGIAVIEFCKPLHLRTEIELFQIKRNKDKDGAGKIMCQICCERELDCAFQCGHTFCLPCSTELLQCPMCGCKPLNPKRIYMD